MMLCEKCAKDNAHAGFVEVNIADLQHFLIDTERYAIGRRSYYPPMAMGTIRKYKKYLTMQTRAVMIHDIEQWMEGTHDGLDYAEEWDALKNELERGQIMEEAKEAENKEL